MIGLLARPYTATIVSETNPNGIAAFPSSNLLNNDYGRVAAAKKDSAGAGTLEVLLDLGAAVEVDVLAVLWHNIVSGTILVRATTNQNGTGVVYDGTLPAISGQSRRERLDLRKSIITLPATITARYWRITLPVEGSGKLNTYSRIFIGKGVKFVVGPQKATLGAKDMNANVTTEVGEIRSQEDQNLIRPVIGLSFEYAKQSEMEELLGQYTLALGVSRPVLVCSDLTTPYLQDNIAFGRLEKVLTLESSVYDVWSFEAVVTSIGI